MATGNLRLTLTNIRIEGHKAQHPIVRRAGGAWYNGESHELAGDEGHTISLCSRSFIAM